MTHPIFNNSNIKIYIDPITEVNYCNYYIQGLTALFGHKSVFLKSKYFKELGAGNFFPVLIKIFNEEIKIIIDYADGQSINSKVYNWCDIYGKINYSPIKTNPAYKEKIVKLPPGFGIKRLGLLNTVLLAGSNYLKCFNCISSTKKFLSPYYKQLTYNRLNQYNLENSVDKNYVFSISTLWFSDHNIDNDATVNLYRYNFFEACKGMDKLLFEGGFVYSMNVNNNPLFQKYVLKNRIPYKQYLIKLKKSVLVFNTPAWDLCHGWKLGEYLALGKAIISTGLINELPAPLEHGKHIHYVSGTIDSIRSAVELIINDHDYRKQLEKGAYDYYKKYVEPEKTIGLLLNNTICASIIS